MIETLRWPLRKGDALKFLIEPLPAFKQDVAKALDLAYKDLLVTFGIKPLRAETGYGYIHAGIVLGQGFKVKRFTEKPNKTKAKFFLAQGNYFWNSGMFCFKVDLFLKELKHHAKVVWEPFSKIKFNYKSTPGAAISVISQIKAVKEIYKKLPNISIDNALMEKCKSQALVEASFSWSDVGSWDEVANHFAIQHPKLISVKSNNNYVLSDIPVALAGVKDLIVVVKNGCILVCKKGSSQLVKEIGSKIIKV